MVALKCGAECCKYNLDNYCCKGSILVEGSEAETKSGTYCASFSERHGGMSNSTLSPDPAVQVDCAACNCTYNKDHACTADHIGIAGGKAHCSEETECASFQCKCGCPA